MLQPVDMNLNFTLPAPAEVAGTASCGLLQSAQLIARNSSPRMSSVANVGQSSPNRGFVGEETGGGVSSEPKMAIDLIKPRSRKWTSKMAKKFNDLAVKSATGNITNEELIQLRNLQEVRRRIMSGFTADQLLHMDKRDRMKDELIARINSKVRSIYGPENSIEF